MGPVFLLLLSACRPTPLEVDANVVVVVLDGVRAQEALGDGPSGATGAHPSEILPGTWAELVPQGLRGLSAWNLGSTITAPAHCALLTARRQAHGNYVVPETGSTLYRPERPSLMESARSRFGLGQNEVLLTGNTEIFRPMAHSVWPEAGHDDRAGYHLVRLEDSPVLPAQDDRQVIERLEELLELHEPRFALANLHDIDRSTHAGADPGYVERIERVDEALVGLWDMLQRHPFYRDRTWLVIQADHGRHTHADAEPPWQHHGDACTGCRHLPLLVLGPDVVVGSSQQPVTLEDLGATFAALMGVDLPWARGRVAREWVDRPLPSSRTGPGEAVAAGGHVAVEELLDDPWRRARVVADAQVLSSAQAFDVGGLAMAAHQGRAWLCFRELVLSPEADRQPWQPRCFADAGHGWRDIGAPVPEVGPFWSPALAASGGELWAAYALNLSSVVTQSSTEPVTVRLARHDGAWHDEGLTAALTFPTDPALVLRDDGPVVAVAASAGGRETADQRRLYVGQPDQDLGRAEPLGLDADLVRMERPALGMDASGALKLAAVAYREAGTGIAVFGLGKAGWRVEQVLDGPGLVTPHLDPIWADGELYYGTVDSQGARICRASGGCLESGSRRIGSLAVDGSRLVMTVDRGVGRWALSEAQSGGW